MARVAGPPLARAQALAGRGRARPAATRRTSTGTTD